MGMSLGFGPFRFYSSGGRRKAKYWTHPGCHLHHTRQKTANNCKNGRRKTVGSSPSARTSDDVRRAELEGQIARLEAWLTAVKTWNALPLDAQLQNWEIIEEIRRSAKELDMEDPLKKKTDSERAYIFQRAAELGVPRPNI
jgi:hypothetical protein